MFKGPIELKKVSPSEYTLLGDFSFIDTKSGREVKVRKGYVTDGASIPRILWSLVGSPFTGKYTASAIVHDALYSSHLLTKESADKLLLGMLKVEKVAPIKSKLMYLGVKYFGHTHWYNSRISTKYVEVRYV